MAHDFPHAILTEVAHRPWPIPGGPWIMTQSWHDLLFAHWTIDPRDLRAQVPWPFEIDLFDGHAWVGIVPFQMTNVALRAIPSVPWLSEFPELNVRTYVRVGDRPGVYFFSLDAGSRLAVRAARALLNLPYYAAVMDVTRGPEGVVYRSRRPDGGAAEFAGTYEPAGTAFTPAAGSLDYFLTERYCLYHVNRRGAPYRLEIHHPPWLLRRARAQIGRNTMAEVNGLRISSDDPHLLFVKRQDMVAWPPTPLGS